MRSPFGLSLVVSVLLGLQLLLAPTTLAAATVTVTPTDSPAEFVCQVAGFRADEEISTWFTGPSQQVMAGDYHTVSAHGRHTIRFSLPRHLQPGRWAITVHGLDSDREAIGFFELTARQPNATVVVSPALARAGGGLTVTGTGFTPREAVSHWLTAPDGRVVAGTYSDADGAGQVTISLTLPAEASPGQWTITLYGIESDALGVGIVHVQRV